MLPSIRQVFFELLQFRRSSIEDVHTLARMRHNDELCPALQRRCEQVVSCLERHHTMVYDVQGPSDAGVDVVVRISDGDSAQFVGFQVKSDVEAVKGVYEKLKAQWVDARSFYGDRLQDYFILLAWDEKGRRDQIRYVEQAFVGIPEVKIVEPAYVATFLIGVSPVQVSALTAGFLSEEDPLLVEARRAVSGWTGRQTALFVEILARHLEGLRAPNLEDLRQAAFVSRLYDKTQALWYHKGLVLPAGLQPPDEELPPPKGDPFEHLISDLEAISQEVPEQEDGRFAVTQDLESILAISYDLKARHRLTGGDLREALLELLSSVHGLPVEQVAATLCDLFWSTDLSGGEQIDLLAQVLRRNYPTIAEGAISDQEPFEVDDDEGWAEVAERLLESY